MRLSFSSHGGNVIKTTDKGSTILFSLTRREAAEAKPVERLDRRPVDTVLASLNATQFLRVVK